MRVFFWSVLALTLVAGSSHAQGKSNWAIIGSKAVQESGLTDLLAADLAPKFNLVEREKLALAIKELTLSEALGSSNVQRLKLGKLLMADVLVFVADQSAATSAKPHLKLVISETRLGTRLCIEEIPYVKLSDARAKIVEHIHATQTRFAKGIQKVIGVPHLVSKNLTHDFDALQSGYAHVLEQALANVPGVAVIETEEAHQLARELGGHAIDQRHVPLFLEGEFRVKDKLVALRFELKAANKTLQTIVKNEVALADVPAFLTGELLEKVLKQAEVAAAKPYDVDQQFRALTRRAQTFAEIGAFEQAIGLREAGLLLKPDDVAERKLIISNYNWVNGRRIGEGMPYEKRMEGVPEYEAAAALRVGQWTASLGHLEYLVRHKQVKLHDATDMMHWIFYYSPRKVAGPFSRDADQARRDFFRHVWPLMGKLETRNELQDFVDWRDKVTVAMSRLDGLPAQKEDLDLLGDLLIKVVPEKKVPPAWTMQIWFSNYTQWVGKKDYGGKHSYFSEAEYFAFLKRLQEAPQKVNQLYGRYGMIRYQWQRGKKNAELLEEATALLKDFPQDNNSWFYVAVRDMQFYLDRELHPEKYLSKPTPPTKLPERTLGRMRFEEIPLKVKLKDGSIQPLKGKTWQSYGGLSHLTRLRACGKDLDVLWSSGTVLFMKEKGLLEVVFEDQKAPIDDVHFDGEHIWIATRTKGLHVLDRAGTVVEKITTIPPADEGILLYPLAKGKMLVFGSFGEFRRGWCATVERGGKVKVFHEATRVGTVGEDFAKVALDPHLSFAPRWVHRLEREEKSPLLLVGRYSLILEGRFHPLAIDLQTLKVSVAPFQLVAADHQMSTAYQSREEQLFELASGGLIVHPPLGSDQKKARSIGTKLNPSSDRSLLAWEGKFYVPGPTWFEINPKTTQGTRLVPNRLPEPFGEIRHFGISAHYGLVGFEPWRHPGEFYQIRVAPKSE